MSKEAHSGPDPTPPQNENDLEQQKVKECIRGYIIYNEWLDVGSDWLEFPTETKREFCNGFVHYLEWWVSNDLLTESNAELMKVEVKRRFSSNDEFQQILDRHFFPAVFERLSQMDEEHKPAMIDQLDTIAEKTKWGLRWIRQELCDWCDEWGVDESVFRRV